MSFNRIVLVGNLGRDPELRYSPRGTPVCTFPLATGEHRTDDAGAPREVTTWFRVTLWGRQAEAELAQPLLELKGTAASTFVARHLP